MSPDPRRTWVCDLARAVSTISLRTAFVFVTYSYSLEFTEHRLYYVLIDISSRWIRSGGLCHVTDRIWSGSVQRPDRRHAGVEGKKSYFCRPLPHQMERPCRQMRFASSM